VKSLRLTHLVITVNGHHTKRGWADRALQRLQEQLAPLGVELNTEKTKVVDTLKGDAFGFLGFDLRRVRRRKEAGYFILMTPKKKARLTIKAKIRDLIEHGGATPVKMLVANINAALKGWVAYFRVGHASRAFNEVRDYTEMKIRTLLSRRKRRRKTGAGWRRWSSTYLYETLGLYWDWKTHPLPSAQSFACKWSPQIDETHNSLDETRWVSCLRENFTSSSYGEGLETDQGANAPAPRQSFTRHFNPGSYCET
jgi:RNA-directed DNA polymerase